MDFSKEDMLGAIAQLEDQGKLPPGLFKAVVQAESGSYYRSLVGNNVWTPGDTSAHGVWEQVWADGAGGWVTKEPDASGPRQWIPDMQVEVGDLVVCDGWIWAAKVAHRTHMGWRPADAAYAVWDKVRAVDEPKRAES